MCLTLLFHVYGFVRGDEYCIGVINNYVCIFVYNPYFVKYRPATSRKLISSQNRMFTQCSFNFKLPILFII